MPKTVVNLSHDFAKFVRFTEAFPGELQTSFFLALRDIAFGHKVKMVEERVSSAETDRPFLAVRSGDLRRKVQDMPSKIAVEGDAIVMHQVLDHPFIAIHEHGTVGAGGELPDIVPVRASWLTIPMDAAKTPAGVALGPAREVGAEYDSTFFRRTSSTKGEQLILYGVRGDSVVPLFLLVKKVAIPARLGFFETWTDMEGWRNKRLKKAVADARKAAKQ